MEKVNFKKVTATIMAIAMMTIPMISEMKNTDSSPISLSSSETLVVSAAEQVRKCYTISTSNTPVFSNTQLTAKIGAIFSSDEVRVHSVTSKYCYVSYLVSGNKYKYGYISTSSILLSTGKNTVTSKGKISTYKRPSTSSGSYGAIYKGDSVKILGEKAGMVQIKYPVNGWYKYAFVTKSDAQTYLNYPNSNSSAGVSISSSMSWPMDNAYCTWRGPGSQWSWGTYTATSTGRNYHLGCDIKGSNNTVKAFATGIVADKGYNSGNGNYVVIKHTISGKTVYSFYAHLKSSACVSKGQNVSKGQKIGDMGNTGNSSGAHLHFAITDTLKSGSYYGYSTYFTGNKTTYGGVTYYSPYYVINNKKLP